MGSRKIFAISTEVRGAKKCRCSKADEDSLLNEKLNSLDSKVSKILKVAPYYKVPLGLLAQLHDTFKCNICKPSPLIPPAILPDAVSVWSVRTSGTLGRMEGETVPFAGLIGVILILQRFSAWMIFW